jgi:dimethylsulfoniopropionate demethylase
MLQPLLVKSPRLRSTPFTARVEAQGVKAYTVYNHTLLPSVIRSAEEDYAHLKSAVQVWDVSCERQVEITGPDARKLVQMSTPRDLSAMQDDQCYYIPNVDGDGRMLNDPVLNKLADDRYWVSIADTQMLFYYKGLAAGMGLDVKVFEPDIHPLAVQGPKANELMRRVFGEDIVATRFFRHKPVEFNGTRMIVARSGWSLQGGFEIYVDGFANGEPLWDTLFEAGEDLDVRSGGPNGIERIEGGLLSFGSDMTTEHTPLEAGLGKYCHLEADTDCLGLAALRAHKQPQRQVRPLQIDGDRLPSLSMFWPLHDANDKMVGRVSSAAWSPDYSCNVAIGMVNQSHWQQGAELYAQLPDGDRRQVQVREKFWL